MDDSAHSLLQHEDTHSRDAAAPVQDREVAVTKGNYQQTASAAKIIEPDQQISRIRLSDKTSRLCVRVQRHLQFLNTLRS